MQIVNQNPAQLETSRITSYSYNGYMNYHYEEAVFHFV